MLISICGNVGSGKTTLAKFIESYYGFKYIPTERLDKKFINDFFANIPKMFLPTQLSFILSKVQGLSTVNLINNNVVLDRSLNEDVNVFARLWMDSCDIEERIKELYFGVASQLVDSAPISDICIVCQCPTETIKERLAKRETRAYEKHYPKDHVNALDSYYKEISYQSRIATVYVDTEKYDFTDKNQLILLCDYIFSRIEHLSKPLQFSLFDDVDDNNVRNGIDGIEFSYNAYRDNTPFKIPTPIIKKDKYIYFAAPFTEYAVESRRSDINNEDSLFKNSESSYGRISKEYQNKLLKIERVIKKNCNVEVHLPHRDINSWGEIELPANYIVDAIKKEVENAAALIAIPGKSNGVHLELGMAISKGIPILVISVKDISQSFFTKGFSEISNVKVINVDTLDEIPAILQNQDIYKSLSMNGDV